MSWRAPASRPAPPITSTSVDSLFGSSSTPAHRPSRTNTAGTRSSAGTNSSAASSLAKHMSDADDGASIRSGRSTLTVGGSRWSSARSRATSNASSLSVATKSSGGSGRTLVERRSTTSSLGGAGGPESPNEQEGEEMEMDAPTRPPMAGSATLDRPESASGSGRVPQVIKRKRVEKSNGASPTFVASPPDENASPSPANLEEPPPLSLANDGAATLDTSAVSPSSEATPATGGEGGQVRRGWFGRPQAQTASSTTASTESKDQQLVSADVQVKARQLALQQASAAVVSKAATGSSWFSSRSKPTGSTAYETSSAVKKSQESDSEDGSAYASGREAITDDSSEASDQDDDRDATLKSSQATLTPRPGRTTQSVSRASWWGWGGGAVSDNASDTNDTPSDPTTPTNESSAPYLPAVASAIKASDAVKPAPAKSWLATIWGEQPSGQDSRKRKADEEDGLANKTAAMAIDPGRDQTDSSASGLSSASSSSASVSSTLALPAPVKLAALRNKASWALFPSRRNQETSAASSPTGPGLHGLASSTTSTRSRTSTDNSAPNSPHLGPHQDNPVKPLTGSVRSSPRPSILEPEPVLDNLVLPTFEDTFQRPPRSFPPEKSRLQSAATRAVSVVSAMLFSQPAPPSPPLEKKYKVDPAVKLPKSLEVMDEPPRFDKIKRIVTIGVHGWFPTAKLRVIFGEPTGTSVKFATEMHDAVHRFLESNNVSSFNIQAIALEGHGEIEERVNKLYDQLLAREEWVESLKRADAVFLATHSQGSVVSTQLLARMLDQDLITPHKTHMLAMCGIAQGPFAYLNQSYALSPYFHYVESAPARELFEFQDGESTQARKFLESLRIVLDSGIKMTVIASLTDQVVPLYSALFSGVSHPGILRAVYIDSDAFRTSDFLSNLVVFANRLRNAGLSDHDLVYHVSEALAGALTGVGHSKVYEEPDTFTLAVRYHFETTALNEAPTHLDPKVPSNPLAWSFNPRERRNQYMLTWALRGMIEDVQIRELFTPELQALREAFETWRPQTKVLKDVKLKLEGIKMLPRAKLKDGKL